MDSPIKVSELADKIALELVFAEPGRDNGLLPINCLLADIEFFYQKCPAPDLVRQAITLARQRVDAALEAGSFSADCLKQLGEWACWIREAITAASQDRALAPLPVSLVTVPNNSDAPTSRSAKPNTNGNETILLDIAANGDMLREFVGEAQEHLHQIEMDALNLEKDPADADTLNSLFRSFHTIKGASGFLNLSPMNRLAHELEALLDLNRKGKLTANRDVIELILSGRDSLRHFVAEIERRLRGDANGEAISVPTSGLLQRILAVQHGGSPTVPIEPGAANPVPVASPPVAGKSATEEAPTNAATSRHASSFVKVDTLKLDSLVDLVGELVIAQSQVSENVELRSLQNQQLSRNLAQLARTTKELQHIAMSLRMVPIRGLFQKMSRVVRDVATKAGKQVELRLNGEATELDRNLIEEINDPLIHLIRNAVDHGIESPEERAARGKPARGLVQLRAFHLGGNITIEIEDDGAGLDQERILAKGVEAGLVQAGVQLSEQEIFSLIFAPGLSTARKVTDISGRGVGLDVVQRNISQLRGRIEVRSTPGKGTTFSIHLPLTLAIIEGLIFSVGTERFIVPTLCVRESFRPAREMISAVQGRGELVNVRGQLSPLLRLHKHFGIEPESTDPTQSLVIMVETNRQHRCLLVDRLLGKQEVVIKSLGTTFKQSRGLAGAAILGDGRVGLILDINELGT